jgi:hypothetical protein
MSLLAISVSENIRCRLIQDIRTEVHLLYEPAYVIACVGNLTEEKFCQICLNFPTRV